MAFSLLPKETQYFALFAKLSEKLKEASASLVEMLSGDESDFESRSKRIKHMEHECDEINHSITTKLFTFPDDTIVLPGHGDDTTIGNERPHLEEWIERRW